MFGQSSGAQTFTALQLFGLLTKHFLRNIDVYFYACAQATAVTAGIVLFIASQ